jgi:hypothetical protein
MSWSLLIIIAYFLRGHYENFKRNLPPEHYFPKEYVADWKPRPQESQEDS